MKILKSIKLYRSHLYMCAYHSIITYFSLINIQISLVDVSYSADLPCKYILLLLYISHYKMYRYVQSVDMSY